jgi:hypothetical protein
VRSRLSLSGADRERQANAGSRKCRSFHPCNGTCRQARDGQGEGHPRRSVGAGKRPPFAATRLRDLEFTNSPVLGEMDRRAARLSTRFKIGSHLAAPPASTCRLRGWALDSQSGVSRAKPRQARPVGIALALSNAFQQVILDQARDRHRHRLGIGRRQRQTHVFQGKRHLEAVG